MPVRTLARSTWSKIFLALAMLEILTGCNPGCCWLINCFPNMRRPQVMKCECDCVLDFEGPYPEPPDDQYDNCDVEGFFDNRKAVTPEDLEPRVDPFNEYRLSVGNLLEISLFGEDELDVEQAVVATDGNIYYSLLGAMPAAGKTLKELIRDLEEALSKYYKNPLVAVVPRYFSQHNYKVLGRVRFPGQFELSFPLTLRDALSQAGGLITEEIRYSDADIRFRSAADLSLSFLVRNGQKLDIDFQNLLYSPDSTQNVYIRPGDYVYIAPSDRPRVFVLGAVRRPRTVSYVKGLTLLGALTSAVGWEGGFPYSPDINKVLILRGSLICPKVIEVDVAEILYGCALDVYLAPGDIVYAQNKTMRFGRELIHLAVESFINSFGTAAGSYYANAYWLPPPSVSSNNDNTTTDDSSSSEANADHLSPAQFNGKRFRR